MRLLAVLPVLELDVTTRNCLATIVDPACSSGFTAPELLIVDNTREGLLRGSQDIPADAAVHRDPDGHNIGVAGAWNVGARAVLADPGIDYLVIVSSAMLFGPILQTTFRREMETLWGERVLEAEGHSWHLIAFHRQVFETVGLFDTNLHPAYFEALDFSFRMRQVGWEGAWRHVWCNAMSQGHARYVETISCPAAPLLAYMADKWGGPKGEETFVLPWDCRPLDYFEETPIPVLAERYGLSTWW